jgi:hypothetical protein
MISTNTMSPGLFVFSKNLDTDKKKKRKAKKTELDHLFTLIQLKRIRKNKKKLNLRKKDKSMMFTFGFMYIHVDFLLKRLYAYLYKGKIYICINIRYYFCISSNCHSLIIELFELMQLLSNVLDMNEDIHLHLIDLHLADHEHYKLNNVE